MFPGQGSQRVGMAAGLRAEPAREVFETANAVLGFDLRTICESGPDEALNSTEVAQLAILTTSVAASRMLEASGLLPDAVAGHSVGEYAALVVARAMSFEDALRAVRARGAAMAREGARRDGGMAAIIGLDRAKVEDVCARTSGTVSVANVNTDDQIVISGARAAVVKAGKAMRDAGARRVIPLQVSVAAHSAIMTAARMDLTKALNGITILEPAIPYVSCITGTPVEEPKEIQDALVRAVTEPVVWTSCVRMLKRAGAGSFVEVGPGSVLAGLIRRVLPDVPVASIGSDQEAVAFAQGFPVGVNG